MSMPGREISTGEIVDDALRSGKEVFIPFIYKTPTDESHKVRKEVMDMLQLRSLEDRNSLKADKWGIPSIGSDTVDGRLNCFGGMGVTDGAMPEDRGDSLDVIVMPGLAFDLDLSRLGHVGLALSEQILPVGQRLPTESWDWPVDAVVIGDGSVLKPRNKSTSR
ncbi:hypothetical protein M8818_003723 [Zalaria obscura]|uniref:Uncharacterized protein n=1 Tax=Zalaria obscura TaxID=2024903 RepID=A0ACC3SF29_9PEZI